MSIQTVHSDINHINSDFNSYSQPVILESLSVQKTFLIKTYLHLLLGVCLFGGALYGIVTTPVLIAFAFKLWSLPMASIVLTCLLIGSSVASSWLANNIVNKTLHYVGLVGYAVVEAIVTAPLVFMFIRSNGMPEFINIIGMTIAIFGCMTGTVFALKPDLGYLGKFLTFASLSAIIMVVVSAIFGLSLGVWFSFSMVVLACGYILYETSQMTKYYNKSQYVACALSLLASIIMLFWYLLRLFSRR